MRPTSDLETRSCSGSRQVVSQPNVGSPDVPVGGLTVFKDRTTSFEVVFPNHSLLDDATLEWLQHRGRDGLSEAQCMALALMRRGQVMDNTRYRAASGTADGRVATTDLQNLVVRELVTRTGAKRGARYRLSAYARSVATGEKRLRPHRRRQILRYLGDPSPR